MKISKGYPSIEEITARYLNTEASRSGAGQATEGSSFAQILKARELEGTGSSLRFSKHAVQRLSDRNIDISPSQMYRLGEGVSKAMSRGISDSLVMVDDLAFIVNTPSSTVVTAMDSKEKNVFSNIDGAVIA